MHSPRGGSRNFGRGGVCVREGDVPPPAQSTEAFSNIAILTHTLIMKNSYLSTQKQDCIYFY